MPEGAKTFPPTARHRVVAWLAIALVALAATLLSNLASRTKSPTFDEPVHLLSSWLIVNKGDFRVNPEHPPLWKMIAGIPLIGKSIDLDLDSDRALSVLQQIEHQGPLATDTLFRRNAEGVILLNRARLTISLFLVLTILVTARWAYASGGWIAALVASALLALDPNFLAHGSLLTNDVAASFIFVLAGYLTWQLGARWRWKTAALLAVTCAAGAGIKFTCVMLVPIVGFPLVFRAISARHWPTGKSVLATRSRRLGTVVALAASTCGIAFVSIWSLYFFRVAPTRSGEAFDASYPRQYLAYNAVAKEAIDRNAPLSDAQIKAAVPNYQASLSTRAIYWLQDHHAIPQALGYGLTYAAGRGILRPSFLLGDYSDGGFWLYFPVAIATKTPLVTLTVLLTTTILGLAWRKSWASNPEKRWLVLCLLSCPAIYLTFACSSNLNIGVRHILPIYPAMYVAAGIALAKLNRTAKPARYVVPGLFALLAIETVSAHPNYLAFFNRAAGGERGGLRLLSDSNLDWGQDLPTLATWYKGWRSTHPDDAFYLAYFGSVDPRLYGIDYVNMSPGFVYDERPPTLDLQRDGVVAISATWLQGTFPPELRPMMANLRARTPIDIINGSIYLYEFKKPVSGK
jgi:hypothetical protein